MWHAHTLGIVAEAAVHKCLTPLLQLPCSALIKQVNKSIDGTADDEDEGVPTEQAIRAGLELLKVMEPTWGGANMHVGVAEMDGKDKQACGRLCRPLWLLAPLVYVDAKASRLIPSRAAACHPGSLLHPPGVLPLGRHLRVAAGLPQDGRRESGGGRAADLQEHRQQDGGELPSHQVVSLSPCYTCHDVWFHCALVCYSSLSSINWPDTWVGGGKKHNKNQSLSGTFLWALSVKISSSPVAGIPSRVLLPVLQNKAKKGPPRQAKYAIHCIHAMFSNRDTQFAQIFEVRSAAFQGALIACKVLLWFALSILS